MDCEPTKSDSPPFKKRGKEETRSHQSGSARTEGYYKLDSEEKARHKSHLALSVAEDSRLVEANTVCYYEINQENASFYEIRVFLFRLNFPGIHLLEIRCRPQ